MNLYISVLVLILMYNKPFVVFVLSQISLNYYFCGPIPSVRIGKKVIGPTFIRLYKVKDIQYDYGYHMTLVGTYHTP